LSAHAAIDDFTHFFPFFWLFELIYSINFVYVTEKKFPVIHFSKKKRKKSAKNPGFPDFAAKNRYSSHDGKNLPQ